MRCLDSFVYGAVFGIMLMFLFSAWFPEDKQCEVTIGNDREAHTFIGVYRGSL